MMLSAFKTYTSERINLLKITIVNSYQLDTAYIAQRWGNLLSTTVYTLSFLLFIHIVYSNVKTIVGYSKNDMLFYTFIGQISFYINYTWSFDNIRNLIDDINQGNLDLTLTKPLPHLFYISIKRISLLNMLRDGLPTIFIIILIQWSNLHITLISLIAGIVIMFFGQICMNVFQFFFALPAFWLGESTELLGLAFELGDDHNIPYEGLGNWFKVVFTTLVPTFVCAALATSVMLQKQNAIIMVTVSVLVAVSSLLFKNYFWQLAIKNYTSASS